MKILESYKQFNINEGDIVLIHYWYNDDITPVKILEKNNRSYLVSHDVDSSIYWNAPNETIKIEDIIDLKR